jgi:hypothetical protein
MIIIFIIIKEKEIFMNYFEAINAVEYYDKETLVPIPPIEAVELAKNWIEENEK